MVVHGQPPQEAQGELGLCSVMRVSGERQGKARQGTARVYCARMPEDERRYREGWMSVGDSARRR